MALVLLSAVAGGCFSLGMWQLGRAAERDALNDAIERGRLQAPMALSPATRRADLTPWRAASAQGHWSSQHTVLLENRNLEGRPGYWVATPLLLERAPLPASRNDAISAGSAKIGAMASDTPASDTPASDTPASDTPANDASAADFMGRGPVSGTAAVLVLRGWLPRDMQPGSPLPQIPAEPGRVRVSGELHAHVPRIFELWSWAGGQSSALPDTLPHPDTRMPTVQNLDLADYARATGLQLLPTVLAQTHDTVVPANAAHGTDARGTEIHVTNAPVVDAAGAATTLQRDWPGPSLDSDQNRGYALQWFSFSAIATIAALFMMRGLLRRREPYTSSKETP